MDSKAAEKFPVKHRLIIKELCTFSDGYDEVIVLEHSPNGLVKIRFHNGESGTGGQKWIEPERWSVIDDLGEYLSHIEGYG